MTSRGARLGGPRLGHCARALPGHAPRAIVKLADLGFPAQAARRGARATAASDLTADIGAGLTVACVAMPLAMAFGIASGVKPEQGLITAVVGGFLVSALGGSRVQIGGPAGAFVALLYAIAERYGIANLLISTMMAGVLLMAMGVFKLGQMVRFVPVPIVIGFTNGIAIVIALSQLKDFLGLEIEQMPANFFSQLATIRAHLDTVNWTAVALGGVALLLLVFWPKPKQQALHRKETVQEGTPATTLIAQYEGTLHCRGSGGGRRRKRWRNWRRGRGGAPERPPDRRTVAAAAAAGPADARCTDRAVLDRQAASAAARSCRGRWSC